MGENKVSLSNILLTEDMYHPKHGENMKEKMKNTLRMYRGQKFQNTC